MGNLADHGEKLLVRQLLAQLPQTGGVEVGPGDDSAVLKSRSGYSIVATIDRLPEDLIGYERGVMNVRELGAYLVAVNLSDLAAMGAYPVGLLVSVGVPDDFELDAFWQLQSGITSACEEFGIPIIGGDTKGARRMSLVAAAIGFVESGRALQRSKAVPGQRVCVTGFPGRFGAALATCLMPHIASRLEAEVTDWVYDSFRAPKPRIDAGRVLLESGKCGACQDVSDGLGQTLIELAASSRVGIEIDMAAITTATPPQVHRVAEAAKLTPSNIVLGPGADLELVFTVDGTFVPFIRKGLSGMGIPVHEIGHVTEGDTICLIDENDSTPIRNNLGFEHFTGECDEDLITRLQSGDTSS